MVRQLTLVVRDPLLAPGLAFITGILLARTVPFGRVETVIETTLFLLIALAAARLAKRLTAACAVAACLFAGAAVYTWQKPGPPPVLDAAGSETVTIAGCVVEPPVLFEGRDQFTLELAPATRARVTLAFRDDETAPALRYGQPVEVEARVRALRNFHNPGSFDFEAYSARRAIYWTAAARGPESIHVQPGRCGSRVLAGVFALRGMALDRIDRLYAGDPYATAMMEAILLGESTKLQKIWTADFRGTGTYHALVISGLHIAVLAGTLIFLLRLCFVPELPALATAAAAAWLYALVSGWSAPAIRAAAGFTLYLIARYFYRRGRVLNLLAAVAIAYGAYDPGQLQEASFQLSFLAVAAIALLAAPLLEKVTAPARAAIRDLASFDPDPKLPPRAASLRLELHLLADGLAGLLSIARERAAGAVALLMRLLLYIADMVAISAAVQAGLAIPMAVYFHRVPLTGLSANLLVVPLLSVVVPAGFLAIFTGSTAAAWVGSFCLRLSADIAAWHARWEPDWRVPDPPLWLALALAAALIGTAVAMRVSRRWSYAGAFASAILLVLTCFHPFAPDTRPGMLEITAVDVGQGDSLFAAFPRGQVMVIDGGGILAFGRKSKPKIDIGEDVVSQYLWARSVRSVDVIACTHFHEDHAGGLPALIDNFHPRQLWVGALPDGPVWREVAAHARARGVQVVRLQAGAGFDYGGAHIDVISPPADYEAGKTARNDDSLVMRIQYGKRAFLLTGDMEKDMEWRALADNRRLQADVLKVGHHGSRTSSTAEFLDAVHPSFALISDGFENSFHHPNRDVLARLAARHASILRTDIFGLITVRTDGTRLSVRTWRDMSH